MAETIVEVQGCQAPSWLGIYYVVHSNNMTMHEHVIDSNSLKILQHAHLCTFSNLAFTEFPSNAVNFQGKLIIAAPCLLTCTIASGTESPSRKQADNNTQKQLCQGQVHVYIIYNGSQRWPNNIKSVQVCFTTQVDIIGKIPCGKGICNILCANQTFMLQLLLY